ncbi:MAG: acyl carrier protein [Bacilli bacterium]
MDVTAKLQEIVKKKLKHKEIRPEDSLKSLGLDSLDKADIMIRIEDEFNIEFTEDEMSSIDTVAKLIDTIESKLK